MFPPMDVPYILPKPCNLGAPGPAPREKVVAGLLLSSPAPPALVVYFLVGLVLEVWAYRCMTGQELVI